MSRVFKAAFCVAALLHFTPDGVSAQEKKPDRNQVAGTRTLGILESAEWQDLFNGTDLTGWKGDTGGYVVEDGVLVCKKGGHDLRTEKQFGDFAFQFEFKLEESGNNGVGIRVPQGGHPASAGMEIQILDNNGPSYKKLKPYQYHGSIYGVVPARRGQQMPLNVWNTEEIVADGSHIKVTLNGHVLVDADIEEAGKPKTIDGRNHPGLFNKSGYIGFLGHGHQIEFRNLRIKELK